MTAMVLLKAILIALILVWAGGFHDWGSGKWYGNENGNYVAYGVASAIVALSLYILFRR